MFNAWPVVVFGFPAAFIAGLLLIVGVALKSARLVAVGALVGLPFCVYLAGTPRFGLAAIAVVCCLAGAIAATAKAKTSIAAMFVVPFVVLCGTVFYIAT